MYGRTLTMVTDYDSWMVDFFNLRSSGSQGITIKGDVSIGFLIMLMTVYFTQSPFNV